VQILGVSAKWRFRGFCFNGAPANVAPQYRIATTFMKSATAIKSQPNANNSETDFACTQIETEPPILERNF
jgi:hypothetical protein